MYRKKLMRACLMGALVVSMATSNVAPVMAAGDASAAETQAKQSKTVIMKVQFVNAEGISVGGGDYFLPEGVQNYSVLDEYVPDGYKMTESGDFTVEENGTIKVKVEKVQKDVIMKVQFVDADGDFISGGDYFLPEGVQNYSVLDEYVPDGYKMTESGDFTVEENGSIKVTVEKIQKNVIVKVQFVDADGKSVGGGDYFLPEGIQNYSVLEQYVPAGYKMTVSGDFTVKAGEEYTINVEKIQRDTVMVVTFEENGVVVGKTEAMTKSAADGETVYFVLGEDFELPAGYKLAEDQKQTTIELPAGSVGGFTMKVEKETTGTMINVTFVDAAGNSHGGGDVIVDTDGDGIFKLDELNEIVPEGYKLTLSGDQFVSDYEGKSTALTVEKIQKGTIIKVVFEDRQGNNLGGGDYTVDEDGDGVANYSELDLPVGYKLIESGDFFVKDAAGGMTVVLDREGSAIIHVTFKSEGGKDLGGGDYFVDADGDGVFNYSELTLPEGYELIETGDTFVDTDKTYEITLHKTNPGTIINVVYVDENGNNVGGGDYFVDMDDNGIANFSELDVPEGYKLVVTGDFFVADYTGQTNEIKVEKIQKGTIINVVFEDRQGNNLGGGDYLV
ncbi:MAG TPA: hypothetical protein H9730_00005, partial [Candidatus Mediterraneibacter stercoripullorum]|nr:hypothetical protein [Candidatus Mediterraneibacter stercoripullorum]